jgi:hypothetical protein
MNKKTIQETELETINNLFKVMGSPSIFGGMFGGFSKPSEVISDYEKLENHKEKIAVLERHLANLDK